MRKKFNILYRITSLVFYPFINITKKRWQEQPHRASDPLTSLLKLHDHYYYNHLYDEYIDMFSGSMFSDRKSLSKIGFQKQQETFRLFLKKTKQNGAK